jgi:hypothetical protein
MAFHVGGMASKGLRAISCQVTRKVKRATTLRIPLKPLLAIPRIGWALQLLSIIKTSIFPYEKIQIMQFLRH